MKSEKSFGEIWSGLTQEQSEYLKGYINRQRIDAINIHEKVSANQIEKLEAEKNEILHFLKYFKQCVEDDDFIMVNNTDEDVVDNTLSKMNYLIQKYK